MTTLARILSKTAISAETIRDRVTNKAEEVLGSKKNVKLKTIWAVGDFPKPWSSDQEEINTLASGDWFPSTEDFGAAIKNSGAKGKSYNVIGYTSSFINFVFMQPKGSITQLNFMTHGSSNSIGLKGTIEVGAVYFDEELEEAVLEGFKNNGILLESGKIAPWSDVKARFAKDARITVYACKAALSGEFLQYLADIFGVTVQGFTKELLFTYSGEALSDGKINRLLLKVDGESDISKLTPNVMKAPSVPTQTSPSPP